MTEDVKHPFLSGMLFERERVKKILAHMLYEAQPLDDEDRLAWGDYDRGFQAALKMATHSIDHLTDPNGPKAGNDA